MYQREKIPSKVYDKIIVYVFELFESISFLVGGMELENNEQMDNKKGTLTDYYFLEIIGYTNVDHVNLLRKRSLSVCIRYFVYWGGITIINCVL